MELFPHRIMREDNIVLQEEKKEKEKETTSPTRTSSSSSPHWAPPSADEREQMFEKVVTPSDVGKLNRLVIPKQHAERYFPLDPASNEKGGLLLNFEEGPTLRSWRFRYSYWNSSQSYVMTKGWSRFVKDKRLQAGDTVSFSRSPATDRLFIDWRHRPPEPPILRSVVPSLAWTITTAATVYHHHCPPPPLYFRSVRSLPPILDSVPVVAHGTGVAPKRRVRLFGVNLESSERQEEEPSPLQWRLSGTVGQPVVRSYSELQLMPQPMAMEEARR